MPVLADDSGLIVEVLAGELGVFAVEVEEVATVEFGLIRQICNWFRLLVQ